VLRLVRALERASAQVPLGEAADGVAKRLLIGRELEVHEGSVEGCWRPSFRERLAGSM
jgi:hypothetical protein